MTFLPMVQRELRVLSRKPATYRWRWIIGGVAFGLALLLVMMMGLAGRPQGWGAALFTTLTIYSGMVCVMAGLFGTADILSEERREGTIGLLFLTDLKGYDVVFGKFSAVALNALYWLLAIIPVLSLPLLMGGVTFGEFVRVSLGLINLLFFAMAMATWASARAVEVLHSLAVAAGLLVLFGALAPAMFSIISFGGGNVGWAALTCSPILALLGTSSAKYGVAPQLFWYPLLSSQLFAWLLLAVAAWRLPKVWQKPAQADGLRLPLTGIRHKNRTTFAERTRWLDENPAMFLMRPVAFLRRLTILLVIGASIVLLVNAYLSDASSVFSFPFASFTVKWLAMLPLKILLAVHACRFFSSARQSGVFELLLSTPLTGRELVTAHWKVINQFFLWPFIILLLYVLYSDLNVFVLNRYPNGVYLTWTLIQAGTGAVGYVFDYILLGWMGAWMGLKLKRPGWAPFFTLLFALVLPSLLCFLSILIKPVLIAVSRHYVVYELPRLARNQFDDSVGMSGTMTATMPSIAPPTLD